MQIWVSTTSNPARTPLAKERLPVRKTCTKRPIRRTSRRSNWKQQRPDRHALKFNGAGSWYQRTMSHDPYASLQNVRVVDDPYDGTQLNVSPDNSALVARDIGTQE